MSAKRITLFFVFLAMVPLSSWYYFRFKHYPIEIEQHDHDSYSLVAFEEPNELRFNLATLWFESTGVIVEDIMNYTQIRVELRRQEDVLESAILVKGEDDYGDHIPLHVE